MVLQYKCPDCGSDMFFDSSSGMLSCESCGRKDPIGDFPKESATQDGNPDSRSIDKEESYKNAAEPRNTFPEEGIREYHCNNCGAAVVTDADTAAATCSFCGAGFVLSDRISGNYAPSMLIPFSINKGEAQAAFKNWCKKGRLTPKGFMTADRIKSITGIYVPFWLYDLQCNSSVNATCTKVRSYSQGDYEYMETSYYDVYRNADITYLKVPADASAKMEDKLMDKLEPYNYQDLTEFKAPYLSGYIAEKYNYTDQDLFPRIKERIDNYIESFLHSTIIGYTTTTYQRKSTAVKKCKAYYTLLPVWMVCYDYKKAEHTFAMNGQTGKVVGKPPLSSAKIIMWFTGISGSILFLFKLIIFLLGGGI